MPSLVNLLAVWISDIPVSKVRICWKAVSRALAASDPSEPSKPRPPLVTEAGVELWPVRNRLLPATETPVGNEEGALRDCKMSIARPPQPVREPGVVCHCCCWSEWEERFVGTGTCPC